MYNCCGCQHHFQSPIILIRHMVSGCPPLANSTEFKCGQPDCNRLFTSGSSLGKHLNRCHPLNTFVNSALRGSSNQIRSASPHMYTSKNVNVSQNAMECVPCVRTTMEPQLASFFSSLYGQIGIPRNVIQSVCIELSDFLAKSQEVILYNFYSLLDSEGLTISTDIKSNLEKVIDEYASCTMPFKSEYKRFKLFQKLGTFFPPSEVIVGQRMEYKNTTLGSQLKPVSSTMQIIPIKEVLEKFLLIPGLLKDVLDYIHHLKSNINYIENIMQGRVWKIILSKQNDSCLHLPLVIFVDDFEVGNPLGSHATLHKLGGIYLSLPFLPNHYVSQLNNILLLGLFHASDRVHFGNIMIFQNIIKELNTLSDRGISVSTNTFVGTIKFHIACITGDNLGLNGILGFVESFVANRCCRICNADKLEIKLMNFEEPKMLRCTESYLDDVSQNNPSSTGIKEKCVFVDLLHGFNLFDHVSVDILHDFLEGACRYVMNYIIKYLVQDSKLVSLNIIQSKLSSFDYGPDSGSKPCNCIVVDGSKLHIKTSAAEMLTLVRYFGVMIGHCIPSNCDEWYLFIYLRKILDRLISPTVRKETSQQLGFLIAGLNELYTKLTKSNLKPKFHFLTHYPTMLLKFGPLTQIWTMRFEAKHRVLKIASRASVTRVNICKTIAIKNQLALSEKFFKNKPFSTFACGKKKKVDAGSIATYLKEYNLKTYDVSLVKWVTKKGYKLQTGSIVTVDLCTETFEPLFGEIQNIYVTSEELVFIYFKLIKVVDFDFHYFAYNVHRTNETMFLQLESLLSCLPNTLTIMGDSKLYVTVRMPLD